MNTIWLKLWISTFFSMGVLTIYSFFNIVKGGSKAFLELNVVVITLSFIALLAIYYLILSKEFEKMYKEYEEAGSLKKIVKKWKGSDK